MLDWTDEMVTRLKALSTEDLSRAQIADVLADEFACQISRSMVIAKLKRLKISRGVRTRKRNKPLPPSAPSEPSDRSCTIDKLTNTTCRWPLWGLPYKAPTLIHVR